MPQMKSALDVFHLSLLRARHLGGLHDAIRSVMTPIIDSSDLLRAQIVLAVSSVDYFVHEITVFGMVEIFRGARAPTDAFRKYKVAGDLLVGSNAGSVSAFEADVRERHSFLSFQQPDKIADAIRLFHGKPLWAGVSARMVRTEESIKTQLRLIVDRRNKIAHEADVDPSFPGERWPISPNDPVIAINFLESLCEAIYSEVA